MDDNEQFRNEIARREAFQQQLAIELQQFLNQNGIMLVRNTQRNTERKKFTQMKVAEKGSYLEEMAKNHVKFVESHVYLNGESFPNDEGPI